MQSTTLPVFGRRAPIAPFEVRYIDAATGKREVQGFADRYGAALLYKRLVRTGAGLRVLLVAAI